MVDRYKSLRNILLGPRFKQDPYPNTEEGLEFRRRVKAEESRLTKVMMSMLPSVFTAQQPSPNYAIHLKNVATQLARLRVALDQISDDKYFTTVRSEFLYQMLAYMVYVDGKYPRNMSDYTFRNYLLSVIDIFFQGSTPKSMEDAIELFFTDLEATVREMALEGRESDSGWGVSDTHKWLVEVFVTEFPSDIFDLQTDLGNLIRIVKAAHTLFTLRFVFSEVVPKPEDELQSWTMYDYKYDDARKFHGGIAGVDYLGSKVPVTETQEDHTSDFGNWIAVTSLLIRTRRGPILAPGTYLPAEDASAVVVRINGVTIPSSQILAVRGMAGEVEVDAVAWVPGSNVDITYQWIADPYLQLVSWDPDNIPATKGYHTNQSHSSWGTRFPTSAVSWPPTTPTPFTKQWKWKGFDRNYTAGSNDPTTLLSNSPSNKSSWSAFHHEYQTKDVLYNAIFLPEDTPDVPWVEYGEGTSVAVSGSLTITDTEDGGFNDGKFLYYHREEDLSTEHIINLACRVQVEEVSTYHGDFSGAALMVVDNLKAIVVGMIVDAGVKKVGVLTGTSEQQASSWSSVAVDWTEEHTYRVQRRSDGAVLFFLDGNLDPDLTIAYESLPYLADLGFQSPEKMMGVYFGSISRFAANRVRWEFVRYYFQPLSKHDTSRYLYGYYTPPLIPQDFPDDPWLLLGAHGEERVVTVGTDTLYVNDVASSRESISSESEVAAGEYRSYQHDIPTLDRQAWVILDWTGQMEHGTEAASGVGVIVDDGKYQVKVCYLAGEAFRKINYNGLTLPEEDREADGVYAPNWVAALGLTSTAEVVDKTLSLEVIGGSDFRYDAGWTSTTTVTGVFNDGPYITSGNDYNIEASIQVESFTGPDGSGPVALVVNERESPIGVNFRLALNTNSGTGVRQLALQTYDSSTGSYTDVGLTPFDWLDDRHTYRLLRNTTDANPANWLVLLYVDDILQGTWAASLLEPSYNTDGVYNHLRLEGDGAITATLAVEHISFYNFDSDGSADKYIGIEVRGEDPTTPHGFSSDPTAFVTAACDWMQPHDYRLIKNPGGTVTVSVDQTVALTVDCNTRNIPLAPVVNDSTERSNYIAFGSFSRQGLSRSRWEAVTYRVFDGSQELVAPHHMLSNQHNVLVSPEHLSTTVPHTHYRQPFSSQGIPTNEFLADGALVADTILNDLTPPVPMSQVAELVWAENSAHAELIDQVMDEGTDFLTAAGQERYVALVTGTEGWRHWEDQSGLYDDNLEFFTHESGDSGLLTTPDDLLGLVNIDIEFESSCGSVAFDSDPATTGFSFISGPDPSTYTVDVGGWVNIDSEDSVAYFSNYGTPVMASNLLQVENIDVSLEVTFRVGTYAHSENRNVGFGFYDGKRLIQFTVGAALNGGEDTFVTELWGVEGGRLASGTAWQDGNWHTAKIWKRGSKQLLEVFVDGIQIPTLSLPYATAGEVDYGVPPFIYWGALAQSLAPGVVESPAVVLGTNVDVDFSQFTVCTHVEEVYTPPQEPWDSILVWGGGKPVEWTYTGGVGFQTGIPGGVWNESVFLGRLGQSHEAFVDLDWSNEDTYGGVTEVAFTEPVPGTYLGSYGILSFPFDTTTVGCWNNYPAYPDATEPGNLWGPGTGPSDCTFWWGPLVLPAWPVAPVNPIPAGSDTVIPLV